MVAITLKKGNKMFNQTKKDWVTVQKGISGRSPSIRNKILISKWTGKKGRKSNLRISIPLSFVKSAGWTIGDYLIMSYCNGLCRLERTNDCAIGYRLAGKKSTKKPSVSAGMDEDMTHKFFPNGDSSYVSPMHEVKPNIIQFAIGN